MAEFVLIPKQRAILAKAFRGELAVGGAISFTGASEEG